jgi:acetoin utilization deacetylase AcuC-like enzyme
MVEETMSDFAIDKNRLDEECIKQPELMSHYGRKLALAKKSLTEIMEAFEAYKTKMSSRIRDEPGKYKVYKVTEGAVTTALKNQEKYREFANRVEEAQYELDLAWSDIHAIQSKQQSLTDLVKLHGQNYFSEVATTKEGVDSILKDKARRKGAVR